MTCTFFSNNEGKFIVYCDQDDGQKDKLNNDFKIVGKFCDCMENEDKISILET